MQTSKTLLGLGGIALGSIALAAATAHPIVKDDGKSIEVSLRTADGTDAGIATVTQTEHGVVIVADLKNLTPGAHGFHIHETGACAPDFGAAGSHYNPLGSEHGFDGEGGYHVGDLPNIYAGEDGTASAEIFVPQINLMGPDNDRYPFTLSDDDGSALMVHANADDYSDMSSAGGREACGVIVADKK